MLFRQFFDHASSTYTYLLAANYKSEAIIIDPVLEQVPVYLQWIEELHLTLVYSVETHMHADHITGAGKLQQNLNCKIIMGQESKAKHVNRHVTDGEAISVEGLALTALYTPGHTDDSYSYRCQNRVFTGDTLLIRGTGRTDFQEGSPYKQYDSLFHKLLLLPDDTLVYPGHNYQGVTVSTIGEEKQHNPRLQVKSADEYAEIMNHLNLSKPKQFDVAVPANMECGVNYQSKAE